MRKILPIFILMTCLIGPLWAGGEAEEAVQPAESVGDASFQVIDILGRTVDFNAPPTRIFQAGKASFILTNTMYLFPETKERFLGTSNANQGFGFFAEDIDSGFGQKKKYSHNISVEELISFKPDLIIAKDFLASSLEKPLNNFGIKTIFMNLESPSNFYKEILTIGAFLDNTERAEEIIGWYSDKLEEISDAIAPSRDGASPSVLVLYYNLKDGVSSFNVPPMNYIQTDMVLKAGGAPVWKDMELGQKWTKVSLEQIAAWDPDYVFVISYSTPAAQVVETIRQDALWKTLTALGNDHVYAFPHDYHSWDQPGPGWILGYRWVAGILHPDLLSSLPGALVPEVREFFRFAYGVDDDSFDTLILPRILGEQD